MMKPGTLKQTPLPKRLSPGVASLWMFLLLTGLYQLTGSAIKARAQTTDPRPELTRQFPAPLPKLALMGATGETVGGTQYHRIAFAITNWEGYPSGMFDLPIGRKLPPNPCSAAKSRVIVAVYSERGAPLAGCIAIPKRDDLGEFSFLIQKGKKVPEFVYAVILDRHTGAAYRSNLVSPFGGQTK